MSGVFISSVWSKLVWTPDSSDNQAAIMPLLSFDNPDLLRTKGCEIALTTNIRQYDLLLDLVLVAVLIPVPLPTPVLVWSKLVWTVDSSDNQANDQAIELW